VKKLEIEKKYLVKFPSWEGVFEMLDSLESIKRIEQVYLTPIKGDPAARIRKTVEGFKSKKTYFDINQKKQIGTMTNKEMEKKISEKEYNKFLSHQDPSKKLVSKTRMVFNFKNQTFELDIFKGYLKGLLILEIELENEKQKVEIPPFIKVLKEVTDEEKFNNFNLADKKVIGYSEGKLQFT